MKEAILNYNLLVDHLGDLISVSGYISDLLQKS